MDRFDTFNVFLIIATNIPQRLKTGFVVQGHMCLLTEKDKSNAHRLQFMFVE